MTKNDSSCASRLWVMEDGAWPRIRGANYYPAGNPLRNVGRSNVPVRNAERQHHFGQRAAYLNTKCPQWLGGAQSRA
ncbi:hypothetical protein RGR602_PC01806 (plasmid) [Rhizobium gallicum bv. gallicum R602sp]|uniref:Uncharacterized protein n=1 Tax=Rhizobium gallicum bv. gallicum R602sp TaxID=1041138 RepID=A0A0B4XGF1_9HYPH|nr:hypothetical protein RGR602_PC01806 [Rhizobium gallicum bv. gallicum R602sp]